MRELLATFINALLSAQADAVCGAEYGSRSAERVNSRNGYRHRDLDTRAGTIDVAIPKLRSGSFFPEWLLERHRRAEAALTTVVATCYLLGVSTRRMDKLVRTLGITGLSKSQVSTMAKDLDEQVEAFRTRPLNERPYTFVAADALTLKVREGGRVVKVAVMIATGVNADGYREILGIHTATTESESGSLGFFRDMVARGLSGVGRHRLVVMADEIYEKILFDDAVHHHAATFAGDDVLCLTFSGLSKAYRVCGYRAGWVMVSGPKHLA